MAILIDRGRSHAARPSRVLAGPERSRGGLGARPQLARGGEPGGGCRAEDAWETFLPVLATLAATPFPARSTASGLSGTHS